jgi:hypothetical protein
MGDRTPEEMAKEFAPPFADFAGLPPVWWCVCLCVCDVCGWISLLQSTDGPKLNEPFRYTSEDCDTRDPEQCRDIFKTQGYIEPYGKA